MKVSEMSTIFGLVVAIGTGGAAFSTLQAKADSNADVGKANAATSLANAVAVSDLVEMLRDEREAQKLADTAKAAKADERIRMTAKFCAIDDYRTTNAVQCAMNDIEQEEDS